jgi:hypothetical protein
MFYIRSGIFALIIVLGYNVNAHCEIWSAVGEKNGNAIYYADDGKGYYRKVSEDEIVENQAPQVYLVVDDSGFYSNYIDETGGGGSYSSSEPDNFEEYSENNYRITHVVIYPSPVQEKYEYKCECETEPTDEEITEREINVSALYPMYFDGY